MKKKTNFEPKFRTVRLRTYPIAGNYDNQGVVIGWSNRGAYQDVDGSGIPGQKTDYLEVMFLDHEKNKDGKLLFEKVKLLDLFNNGVQKHYKIISKETSVREEATGEQITVSMYDPKHGLVNTGEVVDGYVAYSDVTYTIEIPGRKEPLVIDGMFVN